MGFLGSTRGLTPALDAFARNAIVFTRAYAQAPVTTVSHATLLTGTYPASVIASTTSAPRCRRPCRISRSSCATPAIEPRRSSAR